MPDRYLATFFDQFLWNIWGLSWFASLKEHADFPGSVVVIGTDLSDKIKSFLTNHDVILVPLECQYNQRDMDVLHSLAIFSKSHPGQYLYYQSYCYFQKPLSSLFGEVAFCGDGNPQPGSFGLGISTKDPVFIILERLASQHGRLVNSYFFAATDGLVQFLDGFQAFCADVDLISRGNDAFSVLLNLFAYAYSTAYINNRWCCSVADPSYVDAHVCYIPKELQFSADSIKFHFKNRFPDLYRKWHQFYNDVPSRLPIKLLRK